MSDILLGNGQSPDELTLEDLRARKLQVMRLVDEAETKAAEVQRQAEMYIQAAVTLGERMAQADAQALVCKAQNDLLAAMDFRKLSDEMRITIERNAKLADERARLAMEFEEETQKHKSLLRKFDDRIAAKLEAPARGSGETSEERSQQSVQSIAGPTKGEEACFHDLVSTGL